MISPERILQIQHEQRLKAQRDLIAWEKDHIAAAQDEVKRLARAGIADISEILNVTMTPERWAHLNRLDLDQLHSLQQHLMTHRTWPPVEVRAPVISPERILQIQHEQRMKAQRDAIAWEKDHIAAWRDEGKKAGLQVAIADLCDIFAIDLTPERRACLESLNLRGLDWLREQIKRDRAWPAAK